MTNALIEKAVRDGRRSARHVVRIREAELEPRRSEQPIEAEALRASPLRPALMRRVGGRSGDRVLVAEGDSWFDYPWFDVLSLLEDEHGYDVEEVAHRGDRVEDMAYSDGQLAKFVRKVERVIRRGEVPRAILLSGGGNDIAGPDFHILLNHRDSAAPGINDSIAKGLIDERVTLSYARILAKLSETSRKLVGRDLPVIVHGYDYAVPDGRGYFGGWGPLPGPWLEPGFVRKGYSDQAQRKRIVRDLIDRFNACLARLASDPLFGGNVHYIDLRNTLPTGPNYRKWWDNELHPTRSGFSAVVDKIASTLSQL